MKKFKRCLASYFINKRVFKHQSAHQIEELMEESHRSYKFCGNKLVYGEQAASYQAWKHNYLDGYNALLDD